jgi:ribosomal protein S18 acetylase RimI-like enzyme
MSSRTFAIPKDIDTMLDVWKLAAHYPDHPEWDMQDEEQEAALDTLRTVKKLWPLIRVLLLISPTMKDMLHGYVWEENGGAVGTANIGRRGKSDTWLVSNVAVLPDHRRKGIARRLVEDCLWLGKEHGAKKIILDVIDGNLPAQHLYERLGFVNYTTSKKFIYETATAPVAQPLPSAYTLELTPPAEWQPRFALAQRITPSIVQEYEPVVESVYRPPRAALILIPLMGRFSGSITRRYKVVAGDGKIVATARYSARKKAGGINDLSINLDPTHAQLALPLLHHLVREIYEASPGRKIDIEIPAWQTDLIEAALKIGFQPRYGYVRMGLTT